MKLNYELVETEQQKGEGKEGKMQLFLNSNSNSKRIAIDKNLNGKSSSLECAFFANNKVKKGLKRRPKSKFHEYLKMEMTKGVINAEEDLEMERRLVKKLEVKEGKLGGLNDGLSVLIDGITSELGSDFDDFLVSEHDFHHDGSKAKTTKRKEEDLSLKDELDESEEFERVAKGKKQKRSKSSKVFNKQLEEHYPLDKTIDSVECHDASNAEEPPNRKLKPDLSVKYIAPHLRVGTICESEDYAHIHRRVRGNCCCIVCVDLFL